MCWAACDRLARIATRLGLDGARAALARDAERIQRFVDERCWSDARNVLRRHRRRQSLDASLLLLASWVSCSRTIRASRHRRGDRARAEARRLHLPLRRARRFRRAGERISCLHVLVRRTRWRRSAAATRRARCSSACSRAATARPAGRAHRPADRRAVGQLSADLQHGGAHHVGHPAVRALGRGGLERRAPRRRLPAIRSLRLARLDVDRHLRLREMRGERRLDPVAQRMRIRDAHRAGDQQMELEKAPRPGLARAQRVEARSVAAAPRGSASRRASPPPAAARRPSARPPSGAAGRCR